ncbi:hypothetical protein CP965_00105 [Halarcobacter mediterraneus]|uniref:HD domain-containing protein n=1 Tax=Halarcobacter mediterraneus TaxID=2023153 RepID=A0A4Q1B035_9BACT|nr:hypothetical protein CP965_00105 [Halarcobacter mediterraneus]
MLQTKILNRLQFITQNALAYFSYPSITTKRFIHSLGTMHLSSYIFKNSLLNANKETKNHFLKELKKVLKFIVKEEKLNINLDDLKYFDNKALYDFTIPTKNKKDRAVYIIILQAVRIVGLMHDVGHLPFSHQIEYALKNVYNKLLIKNDTLNKKEEEFILLYEKITKNSSLVLHEAIGKELLQLLFDFELIDFINDYEEKELIKLLKTLSLYILENKIYKGFDFSILHRIIDSTVDADRLDYINRDMLASGYITGANDHIRITKQAVLVEKDKFFYLSFFDMSLIDIEHMLEMRFNLYKKVIYNHGIAKTDALLENVVQFLSSKYFEKEEVEDKIFNHISMLWKFQKETNPSKKLDIISLLDENWLISLFKNEYFYLKNKKSLTHTEEKFKYCFEEVLFGKRFFNSSWKNLNEFYKILDFSTIERYQFRESFGYISSKKLIKLQKLLDTFVNKWEKEENTFLTYQTVSFNIGIEKDFLLYDCENLVSIDEISTLRKRLKQSMRNTVPFYLYVNKKNITDSMKKELKELILDVFKN